jgi:hypothetical protein
MYDVDYMEPQKFIDPLLLLPFLVPFNFLGTLNAIITMKLNIFES